MDNIGIIGTRSVEKYLARRLRTIGSQIFVVA